MTPRVVLVRYPAVEAGEERVTDHVTLAELADDLVRRIETTYGKSPEKVVPSRHGMRLDTGGMMMMDQPWVRCPLRGYGVYYKLEHAPTLAGAMIQRIEDVGRRRVYGGVPCVTFYMRYWIAVLPLTDAQTVLRSLKRNALRGFQVGDQRRAELALSPHLHIPGKTPAVA
mgnify:CR=1 FL=1